MGERVQRGYGRLASAAALATGFVYVVDLTLHPPYLGQPWPALLEREVSAGLAWFVLWYYLLLAGEWGSALVRRRGARAATGRQPNRL